MDCKRVKDELVFLFTDNEMNQELLVAFCRHVSACPHCARKTDYTCRLLRIVRTRAVRWPAPGHLRTRILTEMRHRRDRNG